MLQVIMQDPLKYLSFAIGSIGIVIAIRQGFERKKLKQFMHSQAWHLYSISQLSFGSAQSALNAYKEKYNIEIDPGIYEQLSKCDAYNVSLFMEVIRQIQLSEPKFDSRTIATWKAQGRINDNIAPYFLKATVTKTPSISIMIWDVLKMKIREKLTNLISNKN